MSLQSQFDQQAINMLPLIKNEIAKLSGQLESNLYRRTLRACMNSAQPIDTMTTQQLTTFQQNILTAFIIAGE